MCCRRAIGIVLLLRLLHGTTGGPSRPQLGIIKGPSRRPHRSTTGGLFKQALAMITKLQLLKHHPWTMGVLYSQVQTIIWLLLLKLRQITMEALFSRARLTIKHRYSLVPIIIKVQLLRLHL